MSSKTPGSEVPMTTEAENLRGRVEALEDAVRRIYHVARDMDEGRFLDMTPRGIHIIRMAAEGVTLLDERRPGPTMMQTHGDTDRYWPAAS